MFLQKIHGCIIPYSRSRANSHRYNQALSERRANAVKNEMMQAGLNSAEISTVGKSFDDPLIPTGPGVREPQNRRAMIDLGNPPVASLE